jgi:hypothetical protein
MAAKKKNPFLEKMEEKTGKDLDGDREKGESKVHTSKVAAKVCAKCSKAGKKSCSHR